MFALFMWIAHGLLSLTEIYYQRFLFFLAYDSPSWLQTDAFAEHNRNRDTESLFQAVVWYVTCEH